MSQAPATRTALLEGLGRYHRPIATSNADAQRFFDEGLTLLYGFNHEEAFRSFEHAAQLDPKTPMPHWGMALALGTNINDVAPVDRLKQAYTHLAEAQARVANGQPNEQALVRALALRYVADPSGDQMAREQAYSRAMGEASMRLPDDLDLATLYAESLMNLRPWKLYRSDGTPEPGTDVVVRTLEGVLARNANHPGANHYYVHAVEASNDPGRALPSAGRLETLVPGAGHLVHMPAHIYIRTGQYARSAKANATAAAVDEQYFKATGTQGMYAVMYYGHNLQFEAAAAMYAGRFAEAREAARKTAALVEPFASQMAMVEPFAEMEALVLVRFERWGDVLAIMAPPSERPIQTALYHWARGAALAGQGKAMEARGERDAMSAAVGRVPKDAMLGPSNSASAMLAVASADLDGRIASGTGDWGAAVRSFQAAVSAEDRLFYNEPPDWLLPERERLGTALLMAGKPADAERVFREDLTRNPGNPRSLHGLWLSLDAQKKTAQASQAKRDFDLAWKDADVAIPDVRVPK